MNAIANTLLAKLFYVRNSESTVLLPRQSDSFFPFLHFGLLFPFIFTTANTTLVIMSRITLPRKFDKTGMENEGTTWFSVSGTIGNNVHRSIYFYKETFKLRIDCKDIAATIRKTKSGFEVLINGIFIITQKNITNQINI